MNESVFAAREMTNRYPPEHLISYRTYAVGFLMLPHPAIYFTNCILTIITNFPSEHFTPDELPEIVLGPQQIGYPTAGRSAPESRPRTPDQKKEDETIRKTGTQARVKDPKRRRGLLDPSAEQIFDLRPSR